LQKADTVRGAQKIMQYTENKSNFVTQSLQDELEIKYGPTIARDIADRLNKAGNLAKAPDYMDVKAMSELQEKFRAQAMIAIWCLKEWRVRQTKKSFHHNLIELEGVFLERQCSETIKLYRRATTTYFAMYREAMAFLTTHSTSAYILTNQKA
jgi:hypothetical protein